VVSIGIRRHTTGDRARTPTAPPVRVRTPLAARTDTRVQTLVSLCTVWFRQLGQNFLIENFSVWRFLFLLEV